MKQIVCEMCGGTDLIKDGGVFVCQSCGCKYSLEEAKKMMVEGTVEVTGTVKVDNTAAINNFLTMAQNALDASNNKEAEEYANRIIEIEPENYKAWMIKGKAAGWQSTLQNPRFSESVYAFGKAITNCPEDEKDRVIEEAKEEVKKLSAALIQLRASRFEKWPDDEETEGFSSDIQTIFQTMNQFITQTGSAIGMSEMMDPIAEIITQSVQNAWNAKIEPEFKKDSDGYPDDHALVQMLDRAGNCDAILKKAIELSDSDYENDIIRYQFDNKIHNFCINAKSWELKTWTDYIDTWSGREYFTQSQHVVSKDLSDSAKDVRRKVIRANENVIDALRGVIAANKQAEERKAAEAQAAKNAAYWEEHAEEKTALENELADITEQLTPLAASRDDLNNRMNILRNSEKDGVPAETDLDNYKKELAGLESRLSSLGIFKGKEKKAVQAEIDELEQKIEETELKAKEERENRHKLITQQVSELNASYEQVVDNMQPLLSREKEIKEELQKNR